MALAGSGQGAIEGNLETGGFGMAGRKHLRGAERAHGMRRRGALTYFIKFTERIHNQLICGRKGTDYFWLLELPVTRKPPKIRNAKTRGSWHYEF